MSADSTSIHRFLDDAFARVPMTPDLQDLKEEIRGNLGERVAELEERGMDAAQASSTAIAELGDIGELIGSADAPGLAQPESVAQTVLRNRVKPKPGFVVRAVVLSLVLTAAVVLVVLGALNVLDWSNAALAVVAAVGAVAAGVIVLDSLRQETSSHYPLPTPRAVAYGGASLALALGLALAGLFIGDTDVVGLLVAGVVLALAALIAFVWLGVTQTNRTKPWMLEVQRSAYVDDPFSQDPAAAARFGMYTVVIWLIAFGAFVALSIAVGFAWSWVALLLGAIVFMLVLARMLFGAQKSDAKGRE